jgi:hypothetical protein
MKIEPDHGAVREAVGVFNNAENFQDAIDELLSSGFHRAELSLLAVNTRYRKNSAIGTKGSTNCRMIHAYRERPIFRPKLSEVLRAD